MKTTVRIIVYLSVSFATYFTAAYFYEFQRSLVGVDDSEWNWGFVTSIVLTPLILASTFFIYFLVRWAFTKEVPLTYDLIMFLLIYFAIVVLFTTPLI